MTLLQEHIKQHEKADFGVHAYMKDVTTRFSERARSEWGLRREVKCLWKLKVASRTSTAVTILFLPLMMLAGHAAAWTTEANFVTYHYLEPSELNRLKRERTLKKLLMLLPIAGMFAGGLVGVIGLIGVLVSLHPPPPEPGDKPIPFWVIVLVVFVAWGLFAVAVMAQRRLWKWGEPGDSDCFRDKRIQLRDIEISQESFLPDEGKKRLF